ncbi:MAG TPA: endonuclease/exonuclease/phosphatase family protein [Rhodothermales bacterium]|nr:endonuclease/exonuclease/phosphatase family protein [Rhodothermales bacterium]
MPRDDSALGTRVRIVTYNVHRWAGVRGGRVFRPERALSVLDGLDADVIALQEVLLPHTQPDLLAEVADRLGLYAAFATSREHRAGQLGNAVLARRPFDSVLAINLSFGRLDQRSALAVEITTGRDDVAQVAVVATHLSLVDRTRRRQVQALLDHPQLSTPVVLLGDMNAWRRCRATRELDAAFADEDARHNGAFPPTYPAPAPMLALDRVYVRGARLTALRTADGQDARRASDHLPVVATIALGRSEVRGSRSETGDGMQQDLGDGGAGTLTSL